MIKLIIISGVVYYALVLGPHGGGAPTIEVDSINATQVYKKFSKFKQGHANGFCMAPVNCKQADNVIGSLTNSCSWV